MFFLMVLLYRVAPDPNSFMAVRFVHGLAFGTSSTAASTVVAALVPMKRMGTGIGYFVWNEWNNLSLTNVIFAILVIGVVGMLLDLAFGQLQKVVTYVE